MKIRMKITQKNKTQMIKITKTVSLLLILIMTFTSCGGGLNQVENNNGNTDQPTEAPVESPTTAPDDRQEENTTDDETSTVYPVTVTDSYDREVLLEEEPEKIIALSPAITEILFALGQGDKLIARTDYCDYPQEVAAIQSIGGLRDPNIEKIVELEPDIVIAAAHFQEEVLNKLEEAGVKVAILYGEESFDGAYDAIEKIGYLLNAQETASEIIDDMKGTVADVLQKVEGREKPSVYYVVGFGEFGDFTAGSGTFIGQLVEMAGAKNAAGDAEGWSYSLEKLLENDPDYLITSKLDRHKEQIKTTNGYKDLDAVILDRVYEIDKNKLERQGPRLAEGLREIAEYIHPDAFN